MVCFNIYILFNHKDTSQEHEKHKKISTTWLHYINSTEKYNLHPSSYTIIIHIDINIFGN